MCYGLDVIAPLEARHVNTRITSSKLLPRMLELKQKGLNYRGIAEELGVTKRVVEHVIARHHRVKDVQPQPQVCRPVEIPKNSGENPADRNNRR